MRTAPTRGTKIQKNSSIWNWWGWSEIDTYRGRCWWQGEFYIFLNGVLFITIFKCLWQEIFLRYPRFYSSPPVIPSLPQFPLSFSLHPIQCRHSTILPSLSQERSWGLGREAGGWEGRQVFLQLWFFKTKPLRKQGRRRAQREYWRNIRRARRDLRRRKLLSSPPPCPSEKISLDWGPDGWPAGDKENGRGCDKSQATGPERARKCCQVSVPFCGGQALSWDAGLCQ